jgi:glycosyltransferase involved in cell wall biosynthesis
MKILTIVVPCYNSQDYIRRCINSLLSGDSTVEILIIDDGSSDDTATISDEYAKQHPGIIKVIHQVNGGHGAAIGTGIWNASGVFIKIVDSDDWVDAVAYAEILRTLRGFADTKPDMVVSNFVYEKENKKKKTIMRYADVLPVDRIFTWKETGRFRKGQYLLMHSIIYRKDMFRGCGLELPRHTFYVDNLYAYIPLRDVETLYYADVNFYHYYVGRAGQSVQEEVMIKRIDQQLLVNRLMITQVNLSSIGERRLRDYMFHYLEIVTMVSSILLLRSGTPDSIEKKRTFWRFIREQNRHLYGKLRYGLLGNLVHLPSTIGRYISLLAYRLSQKVIGFN